MSGLSHWVRPQDIKRDSKSSNKNHRFLRINCLRHRVGSLHVPVSSTINKQWRHTPDRGQGNVDVCCQTPWGGDTIWRVQHGDGAGYV